MRMCTCLYFASSHTCDSPSVVCMYVLILEYAATAQHSACLFQSQHVIKKYVIKLDDSRNSFGIFFNRVLLLNLISKAQFANFSSEQRNSVFKSPVTFAENKTLARFTFQLVLDVLKLLSNDAVPHLRRQPCLEPVSPSV